MIEFVELDQQLWGGKYADVISTAAQMLGCPLTELGSFDIINSTQQDAPLSHQFMDKVGDDFLGVVSNEVQVIEHRDIDPNTWIKLIELPNGIRGVFVFSHTRYNIYVAELFSDIFFKKSDEMSVRQYIWDCSSNCEE